MDRKTRLWNKTHIAPINKPFNGSGELKKSTHRYGKRIPYPVLVLYTSSFFSVVAVIGRLDSNSYPKVWSTSAGAGSGTGGWNSLSPHVALRYVLIKATKEKGETSRYSLEKGQFTYLSVCLSVSLHVSLPILLSGSSKGLWLVPEYAIAET